MLICLMLLAGCSGTNRPHNELAEKSDSLYVDKITLADDFIMGADVSSVISLENAGVRFHGWNGEECDIFTTLAESGINYIRVRVWNDPFDSKHHGYGGGNCDINTAVEIGKRATANGMKLLVDFHYSDFWADPGKQMVPKAWKGMTAEEKAEALYEYTRECLKKLKDEGIDVGMIQLGNETNGAMCGEKKWAGICKLMIAGSKACREIFPKARIAVHFANPESGSYESYASKLDYYQLDYDVFASSYYPYWHGTLDNLVNELDKITDKYGKEVMVAETSYAYTGEDTDFFGNTISDESAVTRNYPYTVQGQANSIAAVITAVAQMKKGIGVFYWEPAWITCGDSYEENKAKWEEFGCGWASGYARSYDPADAGRYHGGSAVDNQALFDRDGRPLESLKVFNLVRSGNITELKVDAIEEAQIICDLKGDIILPETVGAIMSDNSRQPVAVNWEEIDEQKMRNNGPATYFINGTAEGLPAVCRVSMMEFNYLDNYSFEDDSIGKWQVNDHGNTSQLYVEDKATDSLTGNRHYHFWSEKGTVIDFDLEQEVEGLKSGNYGFQISIMGGDGGKTDIYAYVKINGKTVATAKTEITYYNEWHTARIPQFTVGEGDKVTVGIHVSCEGSGNGAWGKIDDAMLNAR